MPNLWDNFVNRFITADAKVSRSIAEFLGIEKPTRKQQRERVAEVQAILRELDLEVPGESRSLVTRIYDRATRDSKKQANAVNRPGEKVTENLSLLEQETVAILADNLTSKLGQATHTMGRMAEDTFRRHGLRAALNAQLRNNPRGATALHAMEERLKKDGTTSFVDRSGKRWSLSAYSQMVVATTTAEAQNLAVVNMATARGLDLVSVSHHDSSCDSCKEWDGRTFSLTGSTPGYPVLRVFPPFHPHCRHVLSIAVEAYAARTSNEKTQAVGELRYHADIREKAAA